MTQAEKSQEVSTSIVEFRPFEMSLIEYKKIYQGLVYDMDDKKQNKQARSDRLAIGTVVANLDKVHAAVKAPLLEQTKLLDGERKRIKDDLQGVQDGIKKQIEAHDAKLQAIEDALLAKVQAIKDMTVFPVEPTSDQIFERMLDLGMVVIDESYAHHQETALALQIVATDMLNELFAKVSQQEADAAELKKLQAELAERNRADHEKRIRDEAVEADRKRREEDEQKQKDTAARAVAQANEAAAAAEKKAQEANERAANAEKAASEKAYREQQEKEQREQLERDQREADEVNRERILHEITMAISNLPFIKPGMAVTVVEAIAEGKIPHIKIAY